MPDADLLIEIAQVFDTPVSALLGTLIPPEEGRNETAEQLSRINEQLAWKDRRTRRIWKLVAVVLLAAAALDVLLAAAGMVPFHRFSENPRITVTGRTEAVLETP